MKINTIAKLLTLSASTVFAMNATAAVINEIEPNNTVNAPQVVTSNGEPIVINAMMGDPANSSLPDLDVFQFSGKAGDVLTLDIDNGYKDGAPLDSILGLYGAGPEFPLLRMNTYAESIDEGSSAFHDARIVDFVVPADGVYTIGVSSSPRYFYDGGLTAEDIFASLFGMSSMVVTDYQLIISGASVDRVQKINIEVKPGSKGLAPLNPKSKGKVPVAILGALNFSAVNVDTSTITFGATGDEQSLSKCAKSGNDVNNDGHLDLVCHFENQLAGFRSGDIEGILKGQTKAGEMFEGRALLKVLPTMR